MIGAMWPCPPGRPRHAVRPEVCAATARACCRTTALRSVVAAGILTRRWQHDQATISQEGKSDFYSGECSADMEHSYEGIHPSYTPSRDRAIVLGDGRALQVAEWGPEDGTPVVVIHGTPGSRLFCPDPLVTEAAGVRMLAFDRPGYGRSEPARRPLRHADVVSDVVELLDAFGIERVPVIGWSGGGSYALACGAFASERVTSVAAVCSPGEATERDAPPDAVALRKQVAADPEAHRDTVPPRFASGWRKT